MAIKNKNAKIPPREAIESAVGSKTSINAIDIATYFKEQIKNKKPVPYSVVSNKLKKEILSIDLAEGMTIKTAVTTESQRRALRESKDNEITKE